MDSTMQKLKIAVAGTGYVGLSNAVLLAQHNEVKAVDLVPEKVEMLNSKKSPIEDKEISEYLTTKELNLEATLDAKVAYKDEKGVILFSYDKSSQDSEAYSDWAEYLNEFSRHNNSNFSIQEITTTEKTAFNISPNQFTLFIKQGYPSYLYHGFIVEPQVYTAVKKKYMKQELSNMDKSFLPEELHSFRKE